jgi:hypothetical protein
MKESYNIFNKSGEVKRNFTGESMFIVITTQSTDYLRLNTKMGNFDPRYDSILD